MVTTFLKETIFTVLWTITIITIALMDVFGIRVSILV